MMRDLYLTVDMAGEKAALPAHYVESVVEIDDVAPVPCAAPHVLGLFALRSRVLTVIDSNAALGVGRHRRHDTMQAVIVTVDEHLYGLLVDQVDDVVAIEGAAMPPRALLTPGWAAMTEGVLEHDGAPLLLLDVPALINGPRHGDTSLAA
jgi:purine-binding chemotaxis protein CheW